MTRNRPAQLAYYSLLMMLVALGFLAGSGGSFARGGRQSSAGLQSDQRSKSGESKVHSLHVQGGVYMLVGAGSNITVEVGPEALVLVDAGTSDMSEDVLSEIRKLSNRPIEFLIDTSADADHTGGNYSIATTGESVERAEFEGHVEMREHPDVSGAEIIAHVNTLDRMSIPSAGHPAVAQNMWPTDSYDTDHWALFSSEPIIIEHPHAAHTDGDSFVFFRRSDVLSTGDIFTPSHYPVVDPASGGSLNGTIDALNRLLEIIVPQDNEEGGTYVIPGHGRLCDLTDVANYRDMVTIVRDRIQDLVKKGKTLDEVKAAKPTFDYDVIYGSDSGPWSTNSFIEAAYQELSKSKGGGSGRGAR